MAQSSALLTGITGDVWGWLCADAVLRVEGSWPRAGDGILVPGDVRCGARESGCSCCWLDAAGGRREHRVQVGTTVDGGEARFHVAVTLGQRCSRWRSIGAFHLG